MAKPKIIVFDLDGTLLNTIVDIKESVNSILRKNKFKTHSEADYKRFVGDGMRTLVQRAFPKHLSEEEITLFFTELKETYRNADHHLTRPYEGITEMLKQLQKEGIDLAVLSNKPHVFIEATLQQFFPEISFVQALGARDEVPKKPAPDGLLEILNQNNYQANECLYVGDSSTDMQTAKAANVKAVGVLWGFRNEEELLKNGADFLIGQAAELLNIEV